MNDLPDVVVLSATRTAIGRYGGGLAGVPPCDLAATVVREAVSRAGVEPADVGPADQCVSPWRALTRDLHQARDVGPAHIQAAQSIS